MQWMCVYIADDAVFIYVSPAILLALKALSADVLCDFETALKFFFDHQVASIWYDRPQWILQEGYAGGWPFSRGIQVSFRPRSRQTGILNGGWFKVISSVSAKMFTRRPPRSEPLVCERILWSGSCGGNARNHADGDGKSALLGGFKFTLVLRDRVGRIGRG